MLYKTDLFPFGYEREFMLSLSPEYQAIINNNNLNMRYLSKGLHFCNLNIQHIIPKLDELRIVMATENCPDILGLCETFLNPIISNNQVRIEGYDFLRKDRADIQNKTGGGILLYFRNYQMCTSEGAGDFQIRNYLGRGSDA